MMFQKMFNTTLAVIFLILVIVYAYKTMHKPYILSSDNESTTNNLKTTTEENVQNDYVLKSELYSTLEEHIKDYLENHPEDIVRSLEALQRKKLEKDTKLISDYLEENKTELENAGSPPVFGNIKGDVSIIIFYDYICSFCKRANKYLNQIIDEDKNIKVILRPMPILSDNSMIAAKAALALNMISPENFPEIHKKMMEMKFINSKTIKELVKNYNIDSTILDNEMNSFHVQQQINKNVEFAKDLKMKGAPSYIINNIFISGMITTEKFRTIIEEIRAMMSDNEVINENNPQKL